MIDSKNINNVDNNYKCYLVDETEWNEWNKFNNSYGNIFQAKEMALANKDAGMDVGLIIVKKGNSILGGTYYMIPRVRFNWFFNQLRVVSGPVLKDLEDKECLSLILDKLIETAKQNNAITVPLRTHFVGLKEIFKEKGFVESEYAPTHTYCNNLRIGKDNIWKLLSKTQRKKLNRCKRAGIIIREIKTEVELKEFNAVYQNFAFSRKGWVPIPYELFRGIFRAMPDKSKFLAVKHQDKTIAVGLFLLFNGQIIYLANGADEKYKELSGNTLLIWHMLEWGADNNYSLLDIYGVFSNPKDDDKFAQGLSFFKSQFGGILEQRFMYFNRNLSKIRCFMFNKIILPIVLPLYKRIKK